MRCALCGYAFDSMALACHSSCPLSAGCNIVCCPNCGYQTVDERHSGTVNLLLKLKAALSKTQTAKG